MMPPPHTYGDKQQDIEYGGYYGQQQAPTYASPYGQQPYPVQPYDPYGPPPPPPVAPVADLSSQSYGDGAPLSDDLPPGIRNGFIRKVYGILMVQLLYTFGVALFVVLYEPAKVWLVDDGWWMIIIGVALALCGVYALACIPGVARKVPINYVLLAVMTTGFAIIISYSGARVDTDAFLIALGITAALVIALTIFAIQTKIDFTGMGPYLFVILIGLIIFGILAAIFRSNILRIVYASLGAILFSVYLVYDTQQICGGKHRKFQFSIDDYILGAVALYIDIVYLFTFILSLLGGGN